MSIEKNEAIAAVPSKLDTEAKLMTLEDSVKFAGSKEARGVLDDKVKAAVTQKEQREAQTLANNTEQSITSTEKIASPAPEQAKGNWLQRTGSALLAGPRKIISDFKEKPGETSVKTGAGAGLAAGAAYLASGIALPLVGATIATPILAGAAGLAAGYWASGKLINAIQSRWGSSDDAA
jgi:hypothetical protein